MDFTENGTLTAIIGVLIYLSFKDLYGEMLAFLSLSVDSGLRPTCDDII